MSDLKDIEPLGEDWQRELIRELDDLHRRVGLLEHEYWRGRDNPPETAALLRELEEAGKLFRQIIDLGMNQTRYHDILKWLRKRAESWDKPARERSGDE